MSIDTRQRKYDGESLNAFRLDRGGAGIVRDGFREYHLQRAARRGYRTIWRPATFALKQRVPGWSNGLTVKVNGQSQGADIQPGQWATIQREWRPGDTVELDIPLHFRRMPM